MFTALVFVVLGAILAWFFVAPPTFVKRLMAKLATKYPFLVPFMRGKE